MLRRFFFFESIFIVIVIIEFSIKDRGSAVSTNDLIIDNKTNTKRSNVRTTKPKKKKKNAQITNVTTKQVNQYIIEF